MLGLATLLATGLVAFWLVLTIWTVWQLTHPARKTYAWAISRALPGDPGELRLSPGPSGARAIEGLTFRNESVRASPGIDLAAWDIPGADPNGPIVVLSHGWADSRVVMLSRIIHFYPLASRFVAYDSRGHGESGGTCSLGVREVHDVLRIVARVRESDSAAAPIVLYGHSLGAGVSIAAAASDGRIDAVIAEAPYRLASTPARNVLASRSLPHRATLLPALTLLGLTRNRQFDRALHAAKLAGRTRLLVLHGSLDGICPLDDARAIAGAARARLLEIPCAGHTDLWVTPASAEIAANAIRDFLLPLRARAGAHTISQ